MEPYADSVEHLMDELARLDLLLRRALVAARATQPKQADSWRGMVIAEAEIDSLLAGDRLLEQRWQPVQAEQGGLQAMDQGLAALRRQIDVRRELTSRAGRRLALPRLAAQIALCPAEVDLLLIALAPEFETKYETLYAYLQDDATRKRPSVDLALNLICRTAREKVAARGLLCPDAPLCRYGLLELASEAYDSAPTGLRKFLTTNEAVVRYLCDQSPDLCEQTELLPIEGTTALQISPSTSQCLDNCALALRRYGAEKAIVHLVGGTETSASAAALHLAQELGRRVLVTDLSGVEQPALSANELARDVLLNDGLATLRIGQAVELDTDASAWKRAVEKAWAAVRGLEAPLVLLDPRKSFAEYPVEARVWRVEVAPPEVIQRRRAWKAALSAIGDGTAAEPLADLFPFGPSQVRQSVEMARGFASQRTSENGAPSAADLFAAARTLTTPRLSRFAVVSEPRYTWADIMLPPERHQQLRHITARMRFRHMVHGDWGFGGKLVRGRGLTVLFTGPSGTGKTMAAEILAGELGLSLCQIDLSTVVSKYIGETEKHLSVIFREAGLGQTLLFFDEADALFGKRTEVKDAHDRYANLEVNYLLQRIEQYDGIVVLATNLQRNVDEAFLRRMQEVVDFPFPDETIRERIWRGHFPREAPRADDIDFVFLSRQFKLAGGHIKNIVLHAAFLAAQEPRAGEPAAIRMCHLIHATKAELQKLGKLPVKTDFGKYYDLLTTERAAERAAAPAGLVSGQR